MNYEMTIYLDVVLLENLCMNYIILFATGYLLKKKMNHIRLILSALLGGIYSILAYLQILEYSLPCKKYKKLSKRTIILLSYILCIWRVCLCTIILCKTRRNIHAKWKLCRNVSVKNSYSRRNCRLHNNSYLF